MIGARLQRRAEWTRKPASFVSYGSVAGGRGIEQLRLVLFIGDTKDVQQLKITIDDLLWWTRALKAARDRA